MLSETRNKISESLKTYRANYPVSAETRLKMSLHRKGKGTGPRTPFSALTRKRMSKSAKARWARAKYDRVNPIVDRISAEELLAEIRVLRE